MRTAVGCPWQNGVAERWFGSCRRELLDHVIAINESHLRRCSLRTSPTTIRIALIAGWRSRRQKNGRAALDEEQSLPGRVSEVFITDTNARRDLPRSRSSTFLLKSTPMRLHADGGVAFLPLG